MSELLARVAALFVEPAARPARRVEPEPEDVPPAVGVLCGPGDAAALGAATALGLGRGAVLVALWRAREAPALRAPATRATGRLAASLAARDLAATASGRLVRLTLPDDPGEAAAAIRRALPAADVPTVIALAGPRCDELDDVLGDLDALLVARPPDDLDRLADVAVERLCSLAPASLCEPIPSPALRALATAGLLTPPGHRRPPEALRAALASAR